MNKIDLGEKLTKYYRMDIWKPKSKWWLALWMWVFKVCLVNSYVACVKMCTNVYNVEGGNVWSHYEFQEWVALVWISLEIYGPKIRNFIEASRKKQSHVCV